MAAALVPLIAGVLPEVITLIAGLVHRAAPQAEAMMGAGTGPVKFADVFASVMGALTKAAEAGQIPKALPADETVKTVIQAVVSSMKLSGLLDVPTPAPAPITKPAAGQTGQAGQDLVLRAGQSVRITVV